MWIKIHYLDASAAVKLLETEEGSEALIEYMKDPDNFANLFMTSFCVAETLGVLKRKFYWKWMKQDDEKAQEKYLAACDLFIAMLRNKEIEVHNIPIEDLEIYSEVERLAKLYRLDMVDAFQLVTLTHGLVAPLRGSQSECILVVADEPLAKAARKEGLHVWDCLREPPLENIT